MQQDEIGVRDLLLYTISGFRYLRQHWLVLVAAGIIGGCIGFYQAYRQPLKYTAKQTFVVEEAQSGGGLASLAGQFGVSMGGAGGGGIFTGDNILLFFKSQQLVRETLLSPFGETGKTLADQYLDAYAYRSKWKDKPELVNVNYFQRKSEKLSRVEDSLLQNIAREIINKELSVERPDKKASFVEVQTSMRDEQLSKLFCDRLVAIAIDKYVSSKIKLKVANVRMLQYRADSLEAVLNSRTFSAAASQQALLDVNPGLRTISAAPEIKTREKATTAAIYTEVVKNLELAKTIMNQQTPTIEVVDQSSFPLVKTKPSKTFLALVVGIGFALVAAFILLVRRWLLSLNIRPGK